MNLNASLHPPPHTTTTETSNLEDSIEQEQIASLVRSRADLDLRVGTSDSIPSRRHSRRGAKTTSIVTCGCRGGGTSVLESSSRNKCEPRTMKDTNNNIVISTASSPHVVRRLLRRFSARQLSTTATRSTSTTPSSSSSSSSAANGNANKNTNSARCANNRQHGRRVMLVRSASTTYGRLNRKMDQNDNNSYFTDGIVDNAIDAASFGAFSGGGGGYHHPRSVAGGSVANTRHCRTSFSGPQRSITPFKERLNRIISSSPRTTRGGGKTVKTSDESVRDDDDDDEKEMMMASARTVKTTGPTSPGHGKRLVMRKKGQNNSNVAMVVHRAASASLQPPPMSPAMRTPVTTPRRVSMTNRQHQLQQLLMIDPPPMTPVTTSCSTSFRQEPESPCTASLVFDSNNNDKSCAAGSGFDSLRFNMQACIAFEEDLELLEDRDEEEDVDDIKENNTTKQDGGTTPECSDDEDEDSQKCGDDDCSSLGMVDPVFLGSAAASSRRRYLLNKMSPAKKNKSASSLKDTTTSSKVDGGGGDKKECSNNNNNNNISNKETFTPPEYVHITTNIAARTQKAPKARVEL